ncbi:Homeodomain-like DNA binding domain-containing transcription factor [Phycomyces blakesleeanus]|uniref:Homeodomain-like DNA binding domain-containing transcription factor n=2 Tax=Phycomyces blakesleeanus TaxID=4837 RepID=A0A167N2S2_PHYB8|nr:Homeodomain-like DNA binding domain-containing transcription factor [Phycomyces blakesleeanus NRRL 1555(-)]OAD74830.1 Homeodomain-like DNA binding domain-containing transcription factor [Phycomyces blakesleeanus NRRL 1555(-)]|eukprot:XP_018292870.1 Homeodomain-like DNA binding domain-containing transcription factor [Phycomyces blakesleeanus NRRL 1555(-)]
MNMIFDATTMDIVDDYEERTTYTMANAVLHEWEVTYPNSGNGIQTLVTKMDFEQTTTNEETCIQGSDVETLEEENEKTEKKPYKPRGTYCKYMPEQVQGLFELVIENRWTAKMATEKMGINVRTGQNYIAQYRKDEEQCLPGSTGKRIVGAPHKLLQQHSFFLIAYFENNVAATLQEVRTALLEEFQDLMITLSGLQKHLVNKCCLTLKKLEKLPAARNSEWVIQLRKNKVTEWLSIPDFDYVRDCVFIDEAGFNMHIKRNFRRSTRGKPAKTTAPTQQSVSITILGAISQIGVISVTLRKPQAVVSSKKRKLDKKVEKINGHVGT